MNRFLRHSGVGLLLVSSLLLSHISPVGATTQPPPHTLGRVAFVSARSGNFDIFSANLDGSEVTNLTQNPARDDMPAWSPDGQTIAFHSDRANNGGTAIYLMNADGSNVRLFMNGARDAAWSPDGTYLAFQSSADTFGTIQIMKLDGSGRRAITTPNRVAFAPTWSPDGTRITYVWSGNRDDLYTVRTDGTDNRLLVAAGQFEPLNAPHWSPDGRTLVFNGATGNRLHSTFTDSTGQGRLPLLPVGIEVTSASWAPNGQLLVAVCSTSTSSSDLCLVERSGRVLRTIVTESYNLAPAWNPASGSGVPAGTLWRSAFLPQTMRRGPLMP